MNGRRGNPLVWMLEPARTVRAGIDALDDRRAHRAQRRAFGAPAHARSTFRRAG